MTWFMDCFGPDGDKMLANKFPLNSYYGLDLQHLMEKGRKLLERESSGIHKVSFGRSSKGMSPIEIED